LLEFNKKNPWQLLQLRVFEKRIVEAVVFLRQNKIEPILIKGWAAAQMYPEPAARGFNDIDLVVAPQDYKSALNYLTDYPDKYLIDLHKGARHLDRLAFENLYANSQLVECQGVNIRVLRPEDHLRVLCVHWLTDGGAYQIRLWDIFYAVKNRPADFDWERCLNEISQTRRKWIVCTIGLACKYLGLNVEDTPIAGEAKDIPQWLIKTVEKEWESDVKLVPLHYFLNDKKEFFRQIKKRIPPNPILATIDMEGEFDDRPRIFYQIGDIFYRLNPSVRRIAKHLISKLRERE